MLTDWSVPAFAKIRTFWLLMLETLKNKDDWCAVMMMMMMMVMMMMIMMMM
jgi:hypothetical protein